MDESYSRWYILGGECINLGLTHYVQMDCKKDAVYIIQDTCCGRTMVILKLDLVKGKDVDESASAANETEPTDVDNCGTPVPT